MMLERRLSGVSFDLDLHEDFLRFESKFESAPMANCGTDQRSDDSDDSRNHRHRKILRLTHRRCNYATHDKAHEESNQAISECRCRHDCEGLTVKFIGKLQQNFLVVFGHMARHCSICRTSGQEALLSYGAA